MRHLQEDEKYFTIQAMLAEGGSFVKALARAYDLADLTNAVRIEDAFPELIKEYGPHSVHFRHARAAYLKREAHHGLSAETR